MLVLGPRIASTSHRSGPEGLEPRGVLMPRTGLVVGALGSQNQQQQVIARDAKREESDEKHVPGSSGPSQG